MPEAKAMTPLTAKEKLEHIAACPDGCGVCKLMANDVRARVAELEAEIGRLRKEKFMRDADAIMNDAPMTPTREQTEAAARVIRARKFDFGYDDVMLAEEVLTAAAGVRDKPQATFPHGTLLVNTTIERCAQVAETFYREDPRSGHPALAAAIRALKDKS